MATADHPPSELSLPPVAPVDAMPVTTAAPLRERLGSPRAGEIRRLAESLLAGYGLPDWTFAFNRRKRAMGMCYFTHKLIELSIYFVECNGRDEIVDTLLHEIAHALVGPGHGHDAVWKQKCLEIGAKPARFGNARMPVGRWQAACGQCGKRFHRHRRPKRMRGWYCTQCGLEQGKLTWKQNG